MRVDNNITPTGATTAVLSSDNESITITCNSGYIFESAPKVSYTAGPFDEEYNDNATLSADKKSATCTFQDEVTSSTVTITGTAKGNTPTPPPPAPPTVNNHVEHTTVTTSYKDGKVTITITNEYNSSTHRLQNVKAKYTENGTQITVDFNYSVNEQSCTVATATFAVGSGISIDVTGDNQQVIAIEKTLNNCTGNVPDTCLVGETIDITLTANSGTEFQSCTLSRTSPFGDDINNAVTISSDKKTATIHYTTTNDDVDGLTIYGNCVVVEPVGGNYGAINVYVVTDDNLNAFAKVRFESATNGEVKYYDLGKYVNRIKRIFANVENGATDIIKCANYNTGIKVHQPKSDKITLDFGTVTITDHNKDNTDYESNIQLFVPFTGLVTIPNEYIGKEIHLYIDINVITGGGLYRLVCNDIQFQTGECTPSIDVLYRTADANKIGGDTWNENLFMGLEPYIILKWYESKNTNGRNNDFKQGVISSFTGFNSFTDITSISTQNMLANEQQMIYNTLQTGVYIE